MTRWTRRQAMGALGAAAMTPAAFAQKGGSGIVSLPIWREEDGHILADMRVNGETVLGMIDNGPVGVMLSRSWARDKGIDSPKNRTPAGLALRSKGGQKLVVGGTELTFDAGLIDLDSIGLFRRKPLVVIIGAPVLSMMRVLFDFDAGVVQMQPRKAKPDLMTLPGMTVIGMMQPKGSPFPTMEISCEGTPLTADVRLGAGTALEIEDGPLRDRWFSGGRPWSTMGGYQQGQTTSAESKNLVTTLSEVQFGPWKLRDVPVQISATQPGQHRIGPPRATIGADLLARFLVMYDAKERELGFKPGARFNTRFEKAYVGLGVMEEGVNLLVMHVGENSPAADAGFKRGEIVAAINGAPASREAIWGVKPGDKLEITLSDGAKRTIEAREFY